MKFKSNYLRMPVTACNIIFILFSKILFSNKFKINRIALCWNNEIIMNNETKHTKYGKQNLLYNKIVQSTKVMDYEF
jgi:hypothetical protein